MLTETAGQPDERPQT